MSAATSLFAQLRAEKTKKGEGGGGETRVVAFFSSRCQMTTVLLKVETAGCLFLKVLTLSFLCTLSQDTICWRFRRPRPELAPPRSLSEVARLNLKMQLPSPVRRLSFLRFVQQKNVCLGRC